MDSLCLWSHAMLFSTFSNACFLARFPVNFKRLCKEFCLGCNNLNPLYLLQLLDIFRKSLSFRPTGTQSWNWLRCTWAFCQNSDRSGRISQPKQATLASGSPRQWNYLKFIDAFDPLYVTIEQLFITNRISADVEESGKVVLASDDGLIVGQPQELTQHPRLVDVC